MKYRFFVVVDNDRNGRALVKSLHQINSAIVEFRDMFRLHPIMPDIGNLDPSTVQRAFETANLNYKGIDWELEDYLPEEFWRCFINEECAGVKLRETSAGGKFHRDLTDIYKGRLHDYIKHYANYDDMIETICVLKVLRKYFKIDL
jgi:hypothetical protein